MRQGHTLPELAIALTIVGIVTSITVPPIASVLDRLALERAASRINTALAVARSRAVLRASRARLSITPDSVRIEELDDGWVTVARWPGPASDGVTLSASNPVVTFDAIGLAWGLSNTTIQLSRKSYSATITTSRLGRVRRS